jgi:hypothetical protein
MFTKYFSENNKQSEIFQKLLFVLSGLLRNFPYAQNLFVNKYGGIDALSYLLTFSNSVKVKTKILTLIDDLIQEKVNFLVVTLYKLIITLESIKIDYLRGQI